MTTARSRTRSLPQRRGHWCYVRGRHDLPEAAASECDRKPQASGSPVCSGRAAGEEAPTQEDHPGGPSHPLQRPTAANQVWSMGFLFDRTAEGCNIKNLTIVDDTAHEAMAIVSERAPGGNQLVQILEQLASPKRSLGGLTPPAYAKTLMQKQLSTPRLQSPVLLKPGGRRPSAFLNK